SSRGRTSGRYSETWYCNIEVVLCCSSTATRGCSNNPSQSTVTIAATTTVCAKSDCPICFHATGRCTSASAQYLPGGEVVRSGGGAERKQSAKLRQKLRSHGSGSTTRRKPCRGAAAGRTSNALGCDVMNRLGRGE